MLIRNKFFAQLLQRLPYARDFVKNQKRPTLDITSINLDKYSNTIRNVDWVCGAGMVISKHFLKACDGFDSNIFLYGEDEDLCIKAHKQGYRVITADVAPVAHMLGWGGSGFNPIVSDLKFTSLSYFIQKNIHSRASRIAMKVLLPFYVYGYKRFFRAFTINSRIS